MAYISFMTWPPLCLHFVCYYFSPWTICSFWFPGCSLNSQTWSCLRAFVLAAPTIWNCSSEGACGFLVHSVYSFVVQLLSQVQLFANTWAAECQASLSFTISWSLLKLLLIESVMSSNHVILCHPHPLLPSILPCIRVFSRDLAFRIRWRKNWSFSRLVPR